MRVLIIGGGGREHAIARKLIEEGNEVWAAPGNPGIAKSGAHLANLDTKNPKDIRRFVKFEGIDFTVVGPELPLSVGIVDCFNGYNLPIFGPTKAAAEIETSKVFCCKLLQSAGVPIPHTTYYDSFTRMKNTLGFVDKPERIVLKKSGLAAGKGAEVVRLNVDLEAALFRLEKLGDGEFLVQHMEEGPELSFFVLTDGEDFVFLGSAQDYKPLYKGGPNTGGMGGFAPHPILTPGLRQTIEDTIVRPTIQALADDDRLYKGVLYFQLMITKRGPVVIEINCRFGDPETQLLMPLLDCELLPLLLATTKLGVLRMMEAKFKPEVAVGIVMASEGYPDDPKVGREITGFNYYINPSHPSYFAEVFHAGTKVVDNQLVTSGGRVFTVVGRGLDYQTAKGQALMAVGLIKFGGEYHRQDIADEVIAAQAP